MVATQAVVITFLFFGLRVSTRTDEGYEIAETE